MTSQGLLYGFVGAVFGAVATYLVMDRIHERELDLVYEELDELREEAAEEALHKYGVALEAEEADVVPLRPVVQKLGKGSGKDALLLEADTPMEELTENPDGDDPFDRDEEPSEEDDDPDVIYIIPNDQVSGRQVVGVYNHDNGSYEIVKALSVNHEDFDDVIENDALFSLIDEDAYDILMNSEVTEETRMIAVRNDVINLDFVIRY